MAFDSPKWNICGRLGVRITEAIQAFIGGMRGGTDLFLKTLLEGDVFPRLETSVDAVNAFYLNNMCAADSMMVDGIPELFVARDEEVDTIAECIVRAGEWVAEHFIVSGRCPHRVFRPYNLTILDLVAAAKAGTFVPWNNNIKEDIRRFIVGMKGQFSSPNHTHRTDSHQILSSGLIIWPFARKRRVWRRQTYVRISVFSQEVTTHRLGKI